MISYDSVFPFVRTYYAEVPEFLQTLTYAGPGLGMLIKIDTESTDAAIAWPAE
jgi:hypothetical protein